MLGKLIKHEFKATYKLMLISHAFVLLVSLFIGLFQFMKSSSTDEFSIFTYGIFSTYIVLLYMVLAISALFGTHIYIAVRFYRNFFTDEGYLMHTLPTTPTQLLHSKIITGFGLCLFDLIVIAISSLIIYIPLITQILNLGNVFVSGLESFSIGSLLFTIGLLLLEFLAFIVQIYGCICLGQLFHKNRLLAAIVIFLCSNFVKSIVNIFFSLTSSLSATYTTNTGASDFSAVVDKSSNPSIIVSLLTLLVFYGISYYIMNRKVNLI